ncbi:MAG: hypothetical protein MNSN_04990 [Minisyncoccus archaeiphilus]|nr:MAG: hypothetical protein MNSN_04990 [Candidatus Parcubacteria bacterium]
MRRKIKEWEYIWNNVRAHASLNYLTPNEYLEKLQIIIFAFEIKLIYKLNVYHMYLNLDKGC